MPPLSEEEITALYQGCDPNEALLPTDPRNVPVDESVEGAVGPRGAVWARRLERHIVLAKGAAFVLFSGLRGSGKSTELRRFVERLAARGYLPVLVSAESRLALHATVDIPDVLIPLLLDAELTIDAAAAPGEAAPDAGRAPPHRTMQALWRWIERTDAEVTRVEGGVDFGWGRPGDGLRFVLDLRNREPLRERVRRTVAAHLTDFLALVRALFENLDREARALRPHGLVVALDSLEKLSDDAVVQASASRLFVSDAPYLRLPVHALYTIPPSLMLRLGEKVEFMPMIKLRSRAGEAYGPGRAALRTLVDARIPRACQGALFGEDAERQVERIIEASGGYPRALVQLLQAALFEATPEALPVPVDRVLTRQAQSIKGVVDFHAASLAWLGRVAATHRLLAENDQEQEMAATALRLNLVLRYLNDEAWWDVHPWVRDMLPAAAGR